MTKNEIVSHNLQLVMDALSEDEYKKFMANYIKIGSILFTKARFANADSAMKFAFQWSSSKEGSCFWINVYWRIKDDN